MLRDEHIGHLMNESGISEEVIKLSGVESIDESQAKKLFNIKKSGLMFPYYNFKEENFAARLKLDNPFDGKQGRKVKYFQKKGISINIYFLKANIKQVENDKTPLIITEGEKKALAIASCVDLEKYGVASFPGAWNSGGKGENGFSHMWKSIPFKDRDVFLVPDTDFFFNHHVWSGYIRFLKHVFNLGAKIHIVDLRDCSKGGEL